MKYFEMTSERNFTFEVEGHDVKCRVSEHGHHCEMDQFGLLVTACLLLPVSIFLTFAIKLFCVVLKLPIWFSHVQVAKGNNKLGISLFNTGNRSTAN